MQEITAEERWAPIPGRDGYEVSDLGRVRSIDRMIYTVDRKQYRRPGRLLRTFPDKHGYPCAGVARNRWRRVHILVLEAFVGPRPPGMEALHRSGDPTDARLVNLRWGTHGENQLDSVEHGTHNHARRTHCPRSHPLVEPNLTASALRAGRRSCYACSLAQSRVQGRKKRGLPGTDFVAESHLAYAQIMGTAALKRAG